MYRRDNNHIISRSWLTTFGDLLTLLLCFFVCILSIAPLDETGTAKTASNIAETESGTGLAGTLGSGSEIELLIPEAEYAESLTRVSEKVRNMALLQQKPEDTLIREALIETCFNETEVYEGESWYRSIERSLELQRQLVDAGLDENAVAIRSVGPWCETLKENSNRRHFVTRVVFTIGHEVHG